MKIRLYILVVENLLENFWKWGEDSYREYFQVDRKDLEGREIYLGKFL